MVNLFVAVAFNCVYWTRLYYGSRIQCVCDRAETRCQVLYLAFI